MAEFKQYSIQYPRNVFKRAILMAVLKLLFKVLARIEVSGLENIPKTGPLILAGNHVGAIESALMAGLSPRMVEFLAAGDMPLEPQTQFASNNYEFIPVNRGNLDRRSVRMALDVLAQNGVLGIFPEGGTWEPGRMPAQIGVALLSQRGNAHVIPVGMSGIYGAFDKVFKFKRPIMKVRFGKPIPPLSCEQTGQDLKQVLQQYADFVLRSVYDLIDPSDLESYPVKVDYSFGYIPGDSASKSGELNLVEGGEDLAHMLMTDVVLYTYKINLKMPVEPLYSSESPIQSTDFLKAFRSILEMLKQNPGFLSYRFGRDVADRQVHAIHKLIGLLSTGQPLQLNAGSVATFRDGHQEKRTRAYQIVPG